MTNEERADLALVEEYLQAVGAGATGDALSRFYAPDAVQVELPNRLNPAGGRSGLATLLARAEQAPLLLRWQRYEVVSAIARASRVAMEATWTAELAVPLGTLQAGARMRAHFAMFFELRDGRIAMQRNYDCFEPW